MKASYADVLVDTAGGKLDKTFQYRVPKSLEDQIQVGSPVLVPFGKADRQVKAFVLDLSGEARFAQEKIKEISGLAPGAVAAEVKLIRLAAWMRRTYGGSLLQALRIVLPMKEEVRAKVRRSIHLLLPKEEGYDLLAVFEKKGQKARARLLASLLEAGDLDYSESLKSLKISPGVVGALEKAGVAEVRNEQIYREPLLPSYPALQIPSLSDEQKLCAQGILAEAEGEQRPVLLYGVTGSGKTRVYMELIEKMLAGGKEVIVLLPEIALTYQLIWQFRQQFADKAAFIHSRMTQGERWDAFERAKTGRVSIMVGPRTALFTPFSSLGMIIVDEEHETSYRHEGTPAYQGLAVADQRCRLENAQLVLGSATPSVDSWYRCEKGEWLRFSLGQRFGHGELPQVEIVDMGEELRKGNRSIISDKLREEIRLRLAAGEQTLLFLNRRGYAGFISCRNCGYVVKCPHCDVSMTRHKGGRLVCHYCGYSRQAVTACPSCRSSYIGEFKAGTQQIEDLVRKEFPQARVDRMDLDTTRGKEGYSKLLSDMAEGRIDILIGTQMIVKGHDFPNVTLVGAVAADLSLNSPDFRSGERTFQLLVQAIGRAGRGKKAGSAIIQTYQPDHPAIKAAARQDYPGFYEEEIEGRLLMRYPPAGGILTILGSGLDRSHLVKAMDYLKRYLESAAPPGTLQMIGPAEAAIAKVQDRYRMVLHIKGERKEDLSVIIKMAEKYVEVNSGFQSLRIHYDLQ